LLLWRQQRSLPHGAAQYFQQNDPGNPDVLAMNDQTEAQLMLEFIKTTIVRDSAVELSEHTPLVSSGLVDSFALIEVLQRLERVTKRRISPAQVSPNDLDTVAQMLKTAEEVGKKR
jgi:acyl carrier protein